MSFWSNLWTSIQEWTSDCCVCMGGCCATSWNWLSEAFVDSMDWCRGNLCCCCGTDSDDNEEPESTPASPPPVRRSRKSARNTRRVQSKQPRQPHKCTCTHQQPPQQQQQPVMGQQQCSPPQEPQSPPPGKTLSPPSPPPQPQPVIQISKESHALQQQQITMSRPNVPQLPPSQIQVNLGPNPLNLKSTSSGPMRPHPSVMPSHKVQAQQSGHSTAQKMQALKSRVEPPKIDFIETGSIFGDRKRGIDQNMLLLENGRFKSPGQSKIMTGPGGRSIRQSFQTGFPSFKSIESRSSLAESQALSKPRRSVESIKQNQMPKGSQEKMTLDAYKSTASKVSQRRFKSRASMKSIKSSGSLSSGQTKELEADLDDNEPSANK